MKTMKQRVDIYNPLSADLSVMRSSMLYSGLESIRHNINRKNKRLKFFEFGKTYHKPDDYQEIKHLTLLITGNKTRENWLTQRRTNELLLYQRNGNQFITKVRFTKCSRSFNR